MSCKNCGTRKRGQATFLLTFSKKMPVPFFLTLMLLFNISALAQEASVADILFETGKKYYEQGNYSDALHELKKALLANPDHVQALAYIQIIEEELNLSAEEANQMPIADESSAETAREQALEQALEEAE